MINSGSFQNKIAAYTQSSKGKSQSQTVIQSAQNSGKKLASGAVVMNKREMEAAAKFLVSLIRGGLPASIDNLGEALRYSAPQQKADGTYEIVLSFDVSLQRDSISGDSKYKSGIQNIVALFNNGYNTEGKTVMGTWQVLGSGKVLGGQSIFTESVPYREPLQFLQEARDRFLSLCAALYPSVHIQVELGSDYT